MHVIDLKTSDKKLYMVQINHAVILSDIVIHSKQCPEQHQAVATESFYEHMKLYMRPKQSSNEFAHQKATVESAVFEMMSLPLQLTKSLISNLSFVISVLRQELCGTIHNELTNRKELFKIGLTSAYDMI